MTTQTIRAATFALGFGVSALLAGCGGGGGNGGSATLLPVRPFTAWSAVTANSTVQPVGVSHVFEATQINDSVTSINGTGTSDENNTALGLTFGNARVLRTMQFISPTSNVTITHAPVVNSTIACQAGVCNARDTVNNTLALIADPYTLGLEYHTFGMWLSDRPTSASAGVLAVGTLTPGASVPTSGTGAFNGLAIGFYADGSGQPHQLTAQMSAAYDFGARLVTLNTSNTQLMNVNTLVTSAGTGLDVSGNLTYNAGTNLITGPVTSQNGQLSGTANARFFGPNAEEIGGVFALRGAGTQALNASFGGKR